MWQGAVVQGIVDAVKFERQMKEEDIRAHEQRDWAKSMSSSAHQREVRDLREAGLNPILSAGGPGAPSAQGTKAGVPQTGGLDIGAAINSALAAQALKKGKLELKYLEGAEKVYDNNKEAKAAIDGANLAGNAGLDPKIGATYNFANEFIPGPNSAAKINQSLQTLPKINHPKQQQKPFISLSNPIYKKGGSN